MKWIIIFSICAVCCRVSKADNEDSLMLYVNFYEAIMKSDAYQEYKQKYGLGNVSVSNQLLPSFTVKRYFADELGIDEGSYGLEIFKRNYRDEMKVEESLGQISEYQNTNLILYFTFVEDNRIFAEILYNPHEDRGYKNVPVLGISLAYMGTVKGDEVVNLNSKRISNN